MNRPRSGRRKRRLAAGLAACLGALIVLEIVLRVALPPTALLDPRTDAYWIAHRRLHPEVPADLVLDERLGWRAKPGLAHGSVHTNSRGARGRIEHEPDDRVRAGRIVAIGDSFTYGLGVADDETWVARLASELPDTEAIDLGVNGYGVDQALLQFEEEGVRYAPEVVVLGCFVDDYHRNLLSVRELPKPRFVLDAGVLAYVPPPSDAVPGASARPRALDACTFLARKARRWIGADEDVERRARMLELGEHVLRALDRAVRARGARLCVAVIAHPAYDGYPDARAIRASVAAVCAELGVPCVDLGPIFEAAERADPSTPLHGPAGHWSAAGHRRAAIEIAGLVRGS